MSVSVFLSLRAYLQNYPLDLHHIHRLVVLRYVMYFRFYGLRNIRIKSSDRMQSCCRRQADIRRTRLVGIHHC